jgi:hypothetical protein
LAKCEATLCSFDGPGLTRHSGATGDGGDDSYADLPPIQRKIMQYFERIGGADHFPQEGVEIAAIARGSGGNEQAIRDQIENLIADGHLYTTIDEDQYVGGRGRVHKLKRMNSVLPTS